MKPRLVKYIGELVSYMEFTPNQTYIIYRAHNRQDKIMDDSGRVHGTRMFTHKGKINKVLSQLWKQVK